MCLLAKTSEPLNFLTGFASTWLPASSLNFVEMPKSIKYNLSIKRSLIGSNLTSFRLSWYYIQDTSPTSTLSGFKSLCTNPSPCIFSREPRSYKPIDTMLWIDNLHFNLFTMLKSVSPFLGITIQYFRLICRFKILTRVASSWSDLFICFSLISPNLLTTWFFEASVIL